MNPCSTATNLVSTEIYIKGKLYPACLVIPQAIINSIVTPGTPATPSITGTVYANTSATSNNVGVGYSSLGLALTNPVNLNNIGVGYQALSGLTTGSNNVEVGSLTGTLTTGNNNTMVGAVNALNNVTTLSNTIIDGTNNVINGSATYTNSTTIGNGNTINNTNTIVLGNNISTITDNTLYVDPTVTRIQISPSLTVDPTGLGYPLTMNPITGVISRSNIQYQNNVYCSYNTVNPVTYTIGTTNINLVYSNLLTDNTTSYNTTTGVFTSPHIGYYQYLFSVGINTATTNSGTITVFITNGSTTTSLSSTKITGTGTYQYIPLSGIVSLNVSQTLYVSYVPSVTGASPTLLFDGSGGFTIQLLSQI